MQAHNYGLPLYPAHYHSDQPTLSIHPSVQEHYFAPPETGSNFTNSFSRGSSFPYPHHDYRYLLDRGELAPRLCAPSLVDPPLGATGMGFAGNPSSNDNFVPPEDISAYLLHQQAWNWPGAADDHAIVVPAPVYPAEPTYTLEIKDSNDHESVLPSPAPLLPTPAAMAILLNPNGRSDGDPLPNGSEILTGSVAATHQSSISVPSLPDESISSVQALSDAQSREKKHGCKMCHKRFDRPSTLRKHLLVHTGEKAFVCTTCGRRFGVASNLNRHVKRCILKPVNSPSSSNKSTSCSPSASPDSPETSISAASAISPMLRESSASTSASRSGKRLREPSPRTNDALGPPSSGSGIVQASSLNESGIGKAKPSGQKRRRRAPSPSQWVPATLQNFNLLSEDWYRATPVPLPPVRRNPPREERDSWDENIGHTPYHPCAWTGVLPGPGLSHSQGLGGKDVRNMNFGGREGFTFGRVLVF